jgi:hypothetical protein
VNRDRPIGTSSITSSCRSQATEWRCCPTQGPYREYLEADVAPGQVFYVARGGIEVARNVGRREYHEILIELKY